MNDERVQHSYTQNQAQSSWIDDPFGIESYIVKGLTQVNHQKNLSNYAEELVVNYAKYDNNNYYLSLSSLSEYDQNELVRLYIEATDREVNECVYGNDFTINGEFTCAILNMLQNDCKETRNHFAEITRKNILIYYKKSLQQLLDEACENYLQIINTENSYYTYQDRDHGDVVWGKF